MMQRGKILVWPLGEDMFVVLRRSLFRLMELESSKLMLSHQARKITEWPRQRFPHIASADGPPFLGVQWRTCSRGSLR
jgi:hypothetical protein